MQHYNTKLAVVLTKQILLSANKNGLGTFLYMELPLPFLGGLQNIENNWHMMYIL